jgi:hypothetical protein
MPVGAARIPAASRRRVTSSGVSGVAMSMSSTGTPISALRTHPPTKRAAPPFAISAAITARVAGAFTHG